MLFTDLLTIESKAQYLMVIPVKYEEYLRQDVNGSNELSSPGFANSSKRIYFGSSCPPVICHHVRELGIFEMSFKRMATGFLKKNTSPNAT